MENCDILLLSTEHFVERMSNVIDRCRSDYFRCPARISKTYKMKKTEELDRLKDCHLRIFVLLMALNFALAGPAICSPRHAHPHSHHVLAENRALLKMWLSEGMDSFPVDKHKAAAVTTAELEAVLDKGADVNAGFHGVTALMAAVYSGNCDCAKLLIAHGANVNAFFPGGNPLSVAGYGGQLECIKILVAHGAVIRACDNAAYTGAVLGGNIDCVKYFISKGYSPTAQSRSGIPPIAIACFAGKIDLVKFLISKGANVNDSGNCMTPLMAAASAKDLDLVKLLISKGANVNATFMNMTALKNAGHDTQIIAVLKAAGAK
jgi:ankyrin repeat protein